MSEPIDSEIIEIGSKVKIICKDKNNPERCGETIIGIVTNQSLVYYENTAPYAIIRLVLTEPNETNFYFDVIRVNDIQQIELLKEPPESITELMLSSAPGSVQHDIAKELEKILRIMEE
ncbi:MAG: hypothetical protein IKW90_15775 [Lachnospiraceae bacterium]|nr:hypothetical protein [Lachnospiraceae bacterium]